MASSSKEGPTFIHRTFILDGLRALFLAQNSFDQVRKNESYAFGYQEGFEAALLSVAQMAGVSRELKAMLHQGELPTAKNIVVAQNGSR